MAEDKKEEVERPKEWVSIDEVTDEMKNREAVLPDEPVTEPEPPVEEPVVETAEEPKPESVDRWETEGGTVVEEPEPVMMFSSGGEQPFADTKIEETFVDEPIGDKNEGELLYSSHGDQPFQPSAAVIANLEPKIVDALPDEDETSTDVHDYIVKSYKWILAMLVAIIAAIIFYNTVLTPYDTRPNFAPQTAPSERTPGEITRDSLDPRTYFPRQPEVIREERKREMWNNMNLFQRFWYFFFGDSVRDDY